MDGPIYEDDLTTVDPRYTPSLLLLHQHAIAAIVAIDAAECEAELDTALRNMARMATAARMMFTGAEIEKPDMPFGEVGLETRLHDRASSCEDVSMDESDDEDEESDGGDDDDSGEGCSEDMNETSITTFVDLRRVYSLYYGIHLHRIRRLILRLPPPNVQSHPIEASILHLDGKVSSTLQNTPHQPLPPSGAGVPLPQETAIEYAEVIIDELALTAEYRKAMLELLMKDMVGHI